MIVNKWSRNGKSSFHYYRCNQFKVLRKRNLPNFLRRRTWVDVTAHIADTQAGSDDKLLSHVTCPSWQKVEM